MIREVRKIDIEIAGLKVFPNIEIKTELGDGFDSNSYMIRSYIPIDNYLVRLAKRGSYPTKTGLPYAHLMKFVDDYMVEVNTLKKHFDTSKMDENILGVLKIIDYGF